jgi:hypothetical protein
MASFHDVKVGDLVVVRPASRYQPRQIKQVERVTRTQFLAGDYRFSRKDGGEVRAVRGFETRAWAKHSSPELLAEVKAEHRYLRAIEKAHQLRIQVETLLREIDCTHDKYLLADAMEAAAADMAAAVTKLREALP